MSLANSLRTQKQNYRLFPIGLAVLALVLSGINVPRSVTQAAEQAMSKIQNRAGARLASARGRAAIANQEPITFPMVVSGGAANCLPNATATVTITPTGPVEVMDISVSNLPPNNEFDLFVLQIPVAPFGIGWYQGDIETDDGGNGSGEFVGRFSIETFNVAQPPGNAPAPVVHDQPPFPDANINPPFEPIHMYHLGLWFGSVDEAVAAGCPNTETRFNGDHTAVIQVLNTNNFPLDQGPLRQVQ